MARCIHGFSRLKKVLRTRCSGTGHYGWTQHVRRVFSGVNTNQQRAGLYSHTFLLQAGKSVAAEGRKSKHREFSASVARFHHPKRPKCRGITQGSAMSDSACFEFWDCLGRPVLPVPAVCGGFRGSLFGHSRHSRASMWKLPFSKKLFVRYRNHQLLNLY